MSKKSTDKLIINILNTNIMSKKQFKIGQFFAESFKDLKVHEVIDNLESMNDKKEEGNYVRTLTQEELDTAKHEFADVGIKISKIEEEKKEAMDEFKQSLIEPKSEQKELLDKLKFKSVQENGVLYLIADQETNMMYKFDEQGICVDARPLSQRERQTTLGSEMRKVAE